MWVYEDGGYHDCGNEAIGSELEYWLTRNTGRRCRFDNKPLAIDAPPDSRFCGLACKENFEKVVEARLVIGKRDLTRRGFD